MADETESSSAAPSSLSSPPEELSVNISIVSPSPSVGESLRFSGLPASMTVAELKEKIRGALEFKPTNEQQRLIHQGKLLAREQDTFLQVLGEQRIRDTDQFVVHLVLREAQNHGAAPVPSTAPPGQDALHARPPSQPTSPPNAQGGHHPRPPLMWPQGLQPNPVNPSSLALRQQRFQRYRNEAHHMAQMQQRMGTTPPDQARGGQAASIPPPQGSAAVAPNGNVYHLTSQTAAYMGPDGVLHYISRPNSQPASASASGVDHPLTTLDVGNILRAADATQATATMTEAMHRSASNAAMAHLNQLYLNGQLAPTQTPGVTVPLRPASAAAHSRTATPETTRTPGHAASSAQANRTSNPSQPEVYILNSPQGPRALLMNGPAELYYTPAPRAYYPPPITTATFPPAWFPPLRRAGSGSYQTQAPAQAHLGGSAPAQQQAAQQAPQQGNIRVNTYQGPAAAQQPAGGQGARVQPLAPGAAHMHPANPEGNLAAALLAALWPHVWLLIRLAVFVWWFTSANTSWARWFIIMSLATVVFLINTGLFNGLANDVFQPVRQHLEGLIPFAGPEGRDNAPLAHEGGRNNNHNPDAQAGQRRGEPDPAQAAARLVEQRREQNANWLLDQIRRIERASILLLASILPGVAERHIARLEAEARAERERQEAAERAEQERREEEERAAAEAEASATTGQEGESTSGDMNGAQQGGDVGHAGEQQQQQQHPVAAL